VRIRSGSLYSDSDAALLVRNLHAIDDPWFLEKDRTPEDGPLGKRPAKGAGRLNSNRIVRVRQEPFY
jgi:hypothetical protein